MQVITIDTAHAEIGIEPADAARQFGPFPSNPPRWAYLSLRKDLRLMPGAPDPRGWPVIDGSGHPLGRVEDLVVDVWAMVAHSLVVAVDGADRRAAVPLGRFAWDDKRLVFGDDPAALAATPALSGDPTSLVVDETYWSNLTPHTLAEPEVVDAVTEFAEEAGGGDPWEHALRENTPAQKPATFS